MPHFFPSLPPISTVADDFVYNCSTAYRLLDSHPFGRGFQKSVWRAEVGSGRLRGRIQTRFDPLDLSIIADGFWPELCRQAADQGRQDGAAALLSGCAGGARQHRDSQPVQSVQPHHEDVRRVQGQIRRGVVVVVVVLRGNSSPHPQTFAVEPYLASFMLVMEQN